MSLPTAAVLGFVVDQPSGNLESNLALARMEDVLKSAWIDLVTRVVKEKIVFVSGLSRNRVKEGSYVSLNTLPEEEKSLKDTTLPAVVRTNEDRERLGFDLCRFMQLEILERDFR
jgi:hypothetical protein